MRRVRVACDGKERFDSFDRAQEVAHRMSQRRKRRINAYRCRYCRHFHVGSTIIPKAAAHER